MSIVTMTTEFMGAREQKKGEGGSLTPKVGERESQCDEKKLEGRNAPKPSVQPFATSR